MYHPGVKDAVKNNISISPESNVIFLTGANMAGKSTFLKSIGIAMYTAHIGFPIAAEKMEFSVKDGIFTTINLPDYLAMGTSHFYTEVLRVKKMAEETGMGKSLCIIFDELFRGTNVKDAYEATIAVTEAFAQKKDCIFVVSTHIVEAGEILMERCRNINFAFLPTTMNNNKPVYTYQLKQGITSDRHGMVIIRNEGILDIINRRKKVTKMNFNVDQQTLEDLNIPGRFKRESIYRIFDQVVTNGGRKVLGAMFEQPFTNHEAINRRCRIFDFFGTRDMCFPFDNEDFTIMENYLGIPVGKNLVAVATGLLIKKGAAFIAQDKEFDLLRSAQRTTITLLNAFYQFMGEFTIQADIPLRDELLALHKIFSGKKLQKVLATQGNQSLSLATLIKHDHLLRVRMRNEMQTILDFLFHCDVYITVASVAKKKRLLLPQSHAPGT